MSDREQIRLPATMCRSRRGKLDLIDIDHPAGRGLVAVQGAQLLEWRPSAQSPLVWLSPAAAFEAGRPVRGGIPICWPWFGSKEGLPAHGVVRQREWRLEAASDDADGVELRWRFASDAGTRALWPHDFELSLTMRLGAEVDLALAMCVSGEEASVSFALHSYLAVPDVRTTRIEGLARSVRHDKLKGGEEALQVMAFAPGERCDSVFTGALGDYRLRRDPWPALRIETENCPSAIVWTPGEEGAAAMADMADWTGMLCVESGAALDDAITLRPGEWHRVTTRIGLAPV